MFNADGYLDPGLHKMGLTEIETGFVVAFPHSSTRTNILAGYKKHFTELSAIVSQFEQFIDGSFASNKNDPGDVDLVLFIDADIVDNLSPADQAKLMALVSGPITKTTHMCDAYFCPVYPDTHAEFATYRTSRKYWMGEFGFDRKDVPKGIVYVENGRSAVGGVTP